MEDTKRPVGRPRKVEHTDSIPVTVSKQKFDVWKNDSWENFTTGLGTRKDKTVGVHFKLGEHISNEMLTEMYLGGGLATRIVNIFADDMTREWLTVGEKTSKGNLAFRDACMDLDIEWAFNTALRWMRLRGGSFILIGADDGRKLDSPLELDNIKGINYFRPMDATNIVLSNSEWETNPLSPRFGKIKLYSIRYVVHNEYKDIKVHYTRIIEFHNDPFPSTYANIVPEEDRYWGISSLQAVNESLENLGGLTQTTANIIYEYVTGVYKFKGLDKLLASDVDGTAKDSLTKRFEAIDSSRSVMNSIILDSDGEDYKTNYVAVAGLAEILDRYMLLLSGTSGIPVTRLYGRSPAGLNATGEADLRNYYDVVESQQKNRLFNPLSRAFEIIAAWKGIKYNKHDIVFNPLYQLTETEKVTNDKMGAEAKKLNIESDLLLINAGIRDAQSVSKEMGYGKEFNTIEVEQDPPETDEPLEEEE